MGHPNIIYILADDMGYGDVRCNDATSQIPTPNLDRIAETGMRFTDMHATSAVCTPSRYSVLTGRYPWRSRLQAGIVWPWDEPLIEEHELTVAELLRQQGYQTACIGKWHLGWDWATKDGTRPNDTLPFAKICFEEREAFEDNIDYSKPVLGGPVHRGFDTYFGVDVPNFTPYTWFEDDQLTESPSEPKPDHLYGHDGRAVPGWRHEDMMPRFTERAIELIEDAATLDASPLFLYFPLTSPHSPVTPNEEFQGVSGIGNYGDFVCEIDHCVGQLLDALERTGQRDNTLVIFTSDNGPELEVPDDEGAYARAERTGHFSMGPLRGVKHDSWEGGHRIPGLATWPSIIEAGSVCDDVVSLADLLATCADIVGAEIPDGAGEDSASILPLLANTGTYERGPLVLHTGFTNTYAVREGPWVFIDGPSGGTRPETDWFRDTRGYTSHDHPGELYNLEDDPAEHNNLYADHPEIVERLRTELSKIRG